MNRPSCYQKATGALVLARVRALPPLLLGGNVKTYRKEKRAAGNRLATGAGIAAGAPQFAHVRAEWDDWRYWPTRALPSTQARKPATGATGGGPGRKGV